MVLSEDDKREYQKPWTVGRHLDISAGYIFQIINPATKSWQPSQGTPWAADPPKHLIPRLIGLASKRQPGSAPEKSPKGCSVKNHGGTEGGVSVKFTASEKGKLAGGFSEHQSRVGGSAERDRGRLICRQHLNIAGARLTSGQSSRFQGGELGRDQSEGPKKQHICWRGPDPGTVKAMVRGVRIQTGSSTRVG
ncbi:hypothetical protein BO70DRAFT_375903 [Aspergillus heteromorphus CBS 117.55]|uniref:Uncharacterized protein n=1 Tax=Aspergillus heteromorphus CBS 117.55 TaxID=1448321 RepID=A0A317X0H7_9EURO|nr:uncharacterized protein BO70DRAFT_375903 [Aspergillus heteromorphus CBS 117.55]PWY92144.1 hypothetical protein BO70DRAFT_375903 [Aspergillus heteromorphus CBS 117.55]